MEWSDDIISRLRVLWVEGLSTAEIGRRLNVSKNAVVGKAHRLNLPPRPSPIRRGAEGSASPRPQAPRRAQGPTLPPLAASIGGPARGLTADYVGTEADAAGNAVLLADRRAGQAEFSTFAMPVRYQANLIARIMQP